MIRKTDDIGQKRSATSFRPDFIAKDIPDIDFVALRKLGIKACMIDLDGTVVERGTYEISRPTVEVLQRAAKDMQLYIATNRPKSRDLKNLKQDIGAVGVVHPQFIYGKPFKRYFINGVKAMGLRPHEVVMIGDRYIQDIFGSNGAGVYSLLVRKIDQPKGAFDTFLSGTERRYTDRLTKEYLRGESK